MALLGKLFGVSQKAGPSLLTEGLQPNCNSIALAEQIYDKERSAAQKIFCDRKQKAGTLFTNLCDYILAAGLSEAMQLMHKIKNGDLDETENALAEVLFHEDLKTDGEQIALLWAVVFSQEKNLQHLIDKGVSLEVRDIYCNTPLMLAISFGTPSMVKRLLAAGANPDACNIFGATALSLVKNESGNTGNYERKEVAACLEVASIARNVTPVSLKYDFDASKASPIFVAITMGDMNGVRFYIEGGGDINIQDELGCTPLIKAIFIGKLDIASYLLQHNPNVNITMHNGRTALMTVTGLGLLDFAKELFNRGAILDAQTKTGVTALMYAAAKGQTNIALWLIKHGARVDLLDNDGWNARQFAESNGFAEMAMTLNP